MEGEESSRQTPEERAELVREAVAASRKSDVALVFVGYSPETEAESADRRLELPAGQDDLVRAVANANKNTVVVLYAGGPVLMNRWISQVPAVLTAWYPGQEGGPALASILFGDVSPSGKLPVTFLEQWKDSPAYGNYPGDGLSVDYAEGIYVGYRHFDRNEIEPLFPFGHGLSYSSFAFSDLRLSARKITADQDLQVSLVVQNTGRREAAEVVQLYVRDVESSIDRPTKELKGLRRVALKPVEKQTVTFTLDRSSLAFFDERNGRGWVTEPGQFEVLVGASSRDIRVRQTFELTP
jgi:beta-glucosidase